MGTSPFERDRYDAVIAGARCAGASTAMLLARRGLRVLVVDPTRYGSDTLSTHALMRGGVLQLRRWGLLDAIRSSGATPVRTVTFHYGSETVEVGIKPAHGVDALYAPRRTVLDRVLVDAAREAGAEVVHGQSIVEVVRDGDGRVRGARIADSRSELSDVSADLVIGADGIRSRVARILEADYEFIASHAACSIYGYWGNIPLTGYHWFYEPGIGIGTIPTNNGETCVFALIPRDRFMERRQEGLDTLFHEAIVGVSPELAETVRSNPASGSLRAFPGRPGFLRRSVGPGWALVGDAGYFRDPITAHGISDALRDAELLARAIVDVSDGSLPDYQAGRDQLVKGLLTVTDRIASFDWTLEQVQSHHLDLNREMKAGVNRILALDED